MEAGINCKGTGRKVYSTLYRRFKGTVFGKMAIIRSLPLIPEGYEFFEVGRGQYLVREGYQWILDHIQPSEEDGPPVRGHDTCVAGGGRGMTVSMALSGDEVSRVVVRRSLRGGILARILGDTYFGCRSRMFEETRVAAHGIRLGLRAAEVLVAAKERIAPLLYGGWIITREIPDSVDLLSYLRAGPSFAGPDGLRLKRRVIMETAQAIARMHELGIDHGDLHLRNILLQIRPDGAVHVFLIDFDKSSCVDSLNRGRRVRNLMRLFRSVVKEPDLAGTFTTRDVERFLLAYFRRDRSKRKSAAGTFRRHAVLLRVHRAWWRLVDCMPGRK